MVIVVLGDFISFINLAKKLTSTMKEFRSTQGVRRNIFILPHGTRFIHASTEQELQGINIKDVIALGEVDPKLLEFANTRVR